MMTLNAITAWKNARRALAATGLTMASATAFTAGEAAAQDFYKGKMISIMVSGSGSYEAYARVIAAHMGKHIPGNPSFIVKLVQGASGVRAANYIYNVAPKDGTEIGATHAQIPSAPFYERNGVEYDPTKLGWIGSITKETFVAFTWHNSPAKTIEEAMKTPIAVGGQSIGGMAIDMAILSNAMLGTKLKIVTGYDGSTGARLALERGELQGIFGDSLNSIRTGQPDWFNQKKIGLMTQFAMQKHRDLPDVPLFVDYIKNATDRAAVELYIARGETGKPYFAPPGLPAGRLDLLRAAFDSTLKDPGFLAEIEKRKFDMSDPMTGAEIETFVARMASTPPAAIERLNKAFADYSTRK